MSVTVGPVLDEEWARFIQKGVSMVAGSSDLRNVPVVARVAGCRVAPSLDSVTLVMTRSQARPLLDAVAATGRLAAFFSEPSTHRSLQLKGNDARVVRVVKADIQAAARHTEAFVAEIVPLGFTEASVRGLAWSDPGDLAAVRFTPAEAYLQTPGPRAGCSLSDAAR